MKKILIVSDSHGFHDNVLAAMELEKPVDLIFHLGDLQGGEDLIRERARCPVHMVAGNCDYFTDLPSAKVIEVCGRKILLAHGHQYQVSSMGTRVIREKAIGYGCSIAVFGHTHRPLVEQLPGILLLNPGSIALPRQADRQRTYIVLEMEETGEVRLAEIRSLS